MANGTVFVLGGFTNSTLFYQNGLLKFRKDVWYSPLHLGIYGPDYLDLAPDGINPGPLAGPDLIVDGRGIPDRGNIGALYAKMNEVGGGLVADYVGFDWRFSILESAKSLVSRINNPPQGAPRPFYVVAFSQGGLVARVAYNLLRLAGNTAPWTRTVYVASPHGGSYSAAAALCGYQFPGGPTDYFADSVGVVGRRISRPFSSFSSLQNRLLQTVASWPGLYELMPNIGPNYGDLDPVARQLFQQANYAAWNPFVTQARLDSALQTQSYLDSLLSLQRPDEICVYGNGFETFAGIADFLKIGQPGGYVSKNTGDQQIIKERAIVPGVKTSEIRADHAWIIGMDEFLNKIRDLVVNGLPSSDTIPIADPSMTRTIPPPSPPLVLSLPSFPLKQVRGDP